MSSFLASIFSPSALTGWLSYLLALIVIGLLPVKTRPVGRIICLLLAFLWGWLAYAANPLLASADKWVLGAALQAVLLLGLGTFAGKLWFPVRRGAWALAGTALIAGSLVLPFLASFLDLPWTPVFGLPLPLVLFTCGVFFFATGWQASVALLIPLVWALTGGPDLRNPIELWGLTVALLAGSWFALTPPELRGGDERRPSPGAEYLCAYKVRPFFGHGLWGTILITLFLLLSSIGSFLGPSPSDRITTNLALLSGLGIALWLAFPAWQSLWFRYVAWGMARAAGRAWVWFRRAWKWGLLLLAATALILLLGPEKPKATSSDQLPQATRDLVEILLSLEVRYFLLLIFSAAVLLWLILLAYEGRKRLVIGTFANHTGDDKLKDWVPGLGPRLQNELARIADLYRVIDEARPPQKSPVIEVTPSVQDVGEILKQTNASSIDFGIFKIPTDFLLQFVSRLVSGPRLTGALYKGENELFLTAEITGGGRLAGNWHVDMSRLSEEERKLPEREIVYKLVEHLSFRVATHLVSIGSPRWQAVRCFTEGLRSYRETQRQRKDRSRNLREAERCFIRALNDDQKFAQCHYNLGVVYRQLEELGSAESAFRCALVENSENYEAYYALAETFTQASNYAKAHWFCEAAIGVDATDARAWDLKAYARRRHLQEFLDPEGFKSLPPGDPNWKEIRAMREIAVALAWRRLCGKELNGSSPMADKDTAFLCTRNLAVVLTRMTKNRESSLVFHQAAWLAPHDPDLRLSEGKNLFWDEKDPDSAAESESIKVLEGVFDDGLEMRDRGFLWSTVAHVYARSAKDDKARQHEARLAQNRFLDLAGSASVKDLKEILHLGLESPPVKNGKTGEGAS